MKNRERQRANRRKKHAAQKAEKAWKNREGYMDLTAYHGMNLAMGKQPANAKSERDINFLKP